MSTSRAKLNCQRQNCAERGAALMAKIATHDCARSRKRSIDPRTDWVYLLVSYRPLASKQIVDRILGR